MSVPPSTKPDSPRRGLRVSIQGLRKSYGSQVVLKNLSLDVRPGEIFVVMGPSGSGKSVLLKHIIGLEEPDAGTLLVENSPVHGSDVLTRHRVAMVFQSGALLNSLSVGENVGLYLAEHRLKSPPEIRSIVAEKLALVGLSGLEDRPVSELSGGMKKRVSIARALVIEPQLLLYDEPTSELDPITASVIGEEILNLNTRIGVTSIVVSHDRDLAFGIAHRIAIIRDGEILSTGTPDEIRRDPTPFVQEFLHADFHFKS